MSPDWTNKPRRLGRIFSSYDRPVYFVTCVTARRAPWLANEAARGALVQYARLNVEQGRSMGRYVLMPDHVHFLVRLDPSSKLSDYVRLLKQQLSMALQRERLIPADTRFVWQPGFFDRLLRSSERYGDAWSYIAQNAWAAGLADIPDDWPYQGEIVPIRF